MKTNDKAVLILGGYGNFGKRIAKALTKAGIVVHINGRSDSKAQRLIETLPKALAKSACFDVATDLGEELTRLKPQMVINTIGPFQGADYSTAHVCINAGVSYIDLADGREFVTGFTSLDELAKKKGVLAVSGASTVPGLSSAVVEAFKGDFKQLDSIDYGISPGQRTDFGLATAEGVFSYVGKEIPPRMNAENTAVYGWQNLHKKRFPDIGNRWFGNCEIPDHDLLPARYGFNKLRFGAGLEIPMLHLGLWAVSWLIRAGLPINLSKHAGSMLKVRKYFDRFGTDEGGMFVELKGKGHDGLNLTRNWFIVAKSGDGPEIPTIPAISLCKKYLLGEQTDVGAFACVGMVSLEDYLTELEDFDIQTYTELEGK
ncbi:MAG: saccharopine dehydrogenase NADP-binding domain-containing protein [Alphaproteobacteria bacterium]